MRALMVFLVTFAGCGEGGAIRVGAGESEAEAEGEGGKECDSDEVEVGSVCMLAPTVEVERTACGQISENCDAEGDTQANFSCLDSDAPEAPEGPKMVTVTGFVDVFGNGPDSDGVKVTIFDAAELDAAALAAQKDGRLDSEWIVSAIESAELVPLGETIERLVWDDHNEPPPDCRACPNEDDAQKGIPCAIPTGACDVPIDWDAGEWCYRGERLEDRQRWECRYEISEIPTNRRIAIRTAGEDEDEDLSWSPMLQTNLYLFADSKKIEDDVYELEVNVLHRNDYASIPRTIIGQPIPSGKGAVAGEVHDCDDIRVSFAQVGTFPQAQAISYFNGNPIDTLPALTRGKIGTAADGIYAAVNVDAGPVEVAAVVLSGGEVRTVGEVTTTLLPDTVLVVTVGERIPSQ